ncbi:peptidase inhibitor family I36 protein [Nocardia sp. NPDC051756]|uniref:peptidase inhibitor family I36 protein n=1 Tax=Nocardia sp. NPDC051756 TaxID=3154751 RepID=UPI003438E7AC
MSWYRGLLASASVVLLTGAGIVAGSNDHAQATGDPCGKVGWVCFFSDRDFGGRKSVDIALLSGVGPRCISWEGTAYRSVINDSQYYPQRIYAELGCKGQSIVVDEGGTGIPDLGFGAHSFGGA